MLVLLKQGMYIIRLTIDAHIYFSIILQMYYVNLAIKKYVVPIGNKDRLRGFTIILHADLHSFVERAH